MIERTTGGFIGLGGPELVIILAILGLFAAGLIAMIVWLTSRSKKSPTICPHCGKSLRG
jgi:hypothetical protein